MDLFDVNWIAIFVAALAGFAIGGLWYGPVMGKKWMGAVGLTEEQIRSGNMGAIYGGAFAFSLLRSSPGVYSTLLDTVLPKSAASSSSIEVSAKAGEVPVLPRSSSPESSPEESNESARPAENWTSFAKISSDSFATSIESMRSLLEGCAMEPQPATKIVAMNRQVCGKHTSFDVFIVGTAIVLG